MSIKDKDFAKIDKLSDEELEEYIFELERQQRKGGGVGFFIGMVFCGALIAINVYYLYVMFVP